MAYDDAVEKDTAKQTEGPGEPPETLRQGCYTGAKVKVKSLSCVRLLMTPWTAAYQAPPSMGFSRQEYWSGLPLPSLTWEPRGDRIRKRRADHIYQVPMSQLK